jgi:DNA (cytosine-5)-methyltransferase 1
MNKLKVLSLFSGIGAFEKALTNLNIEFELVGFSEIDKYAIKSYCAVHNVDETLNFGDVSKINKDELPEFDLLVGGSPCQAFSVAGHRKGFEDTRGTLFFQYIETLKYKQPKYFVFENVKGLINHDKGNTLNIIAQSFSEVGYRIDLDLLNSKYFNVPQNRERIYIVGIREDLIENEEWLIDEKRKDVLMNGKRRLKDLKIKSFNFKWPKNNKVTTRLKNILEDEVNEKYYLSEKMLKGFIKHNDNHEGRTGFVWTPKTEDDVAVTLRANAAICPTDNTILVGNLNIKGNDSIKRVYHPIGLSPTLTTMGGGHREPKIITVGHSGSGGQKGHIFSDEGLVGALAATDYKQPKQFLGESSNFKVRKLSPLECWRLQAFSDEDFKKAKDIGMSDTQLYKQAGNSITVTVLESIFKELLNTYNLNKKIHNNIN